MVERIFNKKGSRLAVLLIMAVTALAYANTLQNSFVWDDYTVVVNNNFIKSWKNIPSLFGKNYLSMFVKKGCCFFVEPGTGSGETSYRPVVTLSYFLDYSVWGLNPLGYHLTNLFTHMINCIFLFFLIDLIAKNKKIALLASLFFALHPVNSEAVNVISFREELLVLVFILSSFILYIKLDQLSPGKKIYFYALSLALFVLALFSKEMAVSFPFLLILYDLFFVSNGKINLNLNRVKSRYPGYFLVLLFYLWVRFFAVVNISEPPAGYPGGNFFTNIFTMSRVAATYIKWLFLPFDISATIPGQTYLVSTTLFDARVLFSMALIIICSSIAVRAYKYSKESSFAIYWFFITLLPVSNIFPIPNYIASRYLYLPTAGFCFLAAIVAVKWALIKSPEFPLKFLPGLTKGALIILLVFYSMATLVRNISWKNDTVFHREMVKRYPGNALAHFGLAASFLNDGSPDKAIDEYKKALSLNPGLVEACNSLGVLFGNKGEYIEAINFFKQAIKVDPNNLQAYDNLAVTYTRIDKMALARNAWERSLEVDPGFETARNNLKKLKELGY